MGRFTKMADIYQTLYQKMEKIGIFDVKQYAVIERQPFVPLCIDHLSDTVYALSQNPIIDGEQVADPDFEIQVDLQRKTAEPLICQDRNGRRVVYPMPGKVDLKTKNDLCRFLDQWLTDLIQKGFILHQ
jgi:hypothetical protein